MKLRALKRRARNRFLKPYRAGRGCWGEHNHWGEQEPPAGILIEAGRGRLVVDSARPLRS
jgi:hypothetical protein